VWDPYRSYGALIAGRTTHANHTDGCTGQPHVRAAGLTQSYTVTSARYDCDVNRVSGRFVSWKVFWNFAEIVIFAVRTVFVLGILNLKIISE
jgi:hypothetical protein